MLAVGIGACVTEACFASIPGPTYVSCVGMECEQGSTCIEDFDSRGQAYAACAIGGVPDPKCNRDTNKRFCDGNTLVRCVGSYRVENFECGGDTCAEAFASAQCVPIAEVDPACDAAKKTSMHCDGDDAITCFGPYANERTDCAFRGRLCRAGACVLRPDPDPRCDALRDGDVTFCDGNLAVQCFQGFHQEEHDCAKGGLRCVDRGFSITCE